MSSEQGAGQSDLLAEKGSGKSAALLKWFAQSMVRLDRSNIRGVYAIGPDARWWMPFWTGRIPGFL
jgi:hypothetical protein